jgi:hypothetical protein
MSHDYPQKTVVQASTLEAKLASRNAQITMVGVFGLLLILPLWLVKYPPLVDYPNHLARAFVLHHLNDPNYNFGHFFAPDWGLNPYCLADFLLQVFQHFVGIYAAGRLLLTVCILGLPLGVAFFLRRANPGNEYLALWAFAVAYNPNFLMGFMSFVLSVALCFVVVGLWLDYLHTGQEKYWLMTLVLATLTFLTHLGGFAIAGMVIVLYTVLDAPVADLKIRNYMDLMGRLLMAGLAFVPGASFLLYARLHGWAGRGPDYRHWSINLKLRGMTVPFREYSRTVEAITILALLVTIGYFLSRRRELRLQFVWMAIVAAIVALHWIVPDALGDLGFVDYRFCIFAFLFSLAIPVFRGPRIVPVALATVVFLAHVLQAGTYFVSEQKHLQRLANDFQYIPQKALVLAYTSRGVGVPWEKQDDLHFWGYGVIERGWITPSLFHQSGVQPLQLRVPMYSDDDQYGDKLQERKYNEESISKAYDYLWTTNVGYLNPYLEKMGNPVCSQGELQIIKTKKDQVAALARARLSH